MSRFAFVIDDNRLIANSLVQMLKLLDYEAQAVYGSLAAIQALSRQVPDLIVTDIHMQGINGVELCRYIRRDPRLANVPILAISTDNQDVMVRGVREAGANVFLNKPIEFETLEWALKQIENPSDTTRLLKDRPDASTQTRPHQKK